MILRTPGVIPRNPLLICSEQGRRYPGPTTSLDLAPMVVSLNHEAYKYEKASEDDAVRNDSKDGQSGDRDHDRAYGESYSETPHGWRLVGRNQRS
jgi:hypothetical protein